MNQPGIGMKQTKDTQMETKDNDFLFFCHRVKVINKCQFSWVSLSPKQFLNNLGRFIS